MKEYCRKCHISFGKTEPRIAVAPDVHVHVECYMNMLREVTNREDLARGGDPRLVQH